MKSSSQKSEHVLVIPGGLLAPRPHADPGCSVPAHEVDGDLAQDSQVAGRRPIPNAAVILPEGDIQHPMEPSGIPSFLGMGEVDPDVWHLKYRSTEAAM